MDDKREFIDGNRCPDLKITGNDTPPADPRFKSCRIVFLSAAAPNQCFRTAGGNSGNALHAGNRAGCIFFVSMIHPQCVRLMRETIFRWESDWFFNKKGVFQFILDYANARDDPGSCMIFPNGRISR
jgi:hypothetical protein